MIQFEFRRDLWRPWAIMRHYLRDPTFSHFDTIPECYRHTHRQTDRHSDGIYRASIASLSKNWLMNVKDIAAKAVSFLVYHMTEETQFIAFMVPQIVQRH